MVCDKSSEHKFMKAAGKVFLFELPAMIGPPLIYYESKSFFDIE
jgi:hypothetical protein